MNKLNLSETKINEEIKNQRFDQFMQLQAKISAEQLQQKCGKILPVIVDEVNQQNIIARSMGDAPDIDGAVILPNAQQLSVGDIVETLIESADEYDLYGHVAD